MDVRSLGRKWLPAPLFRVAGDVHWYATHPGLIAWAWPFGELLAALRPLRAQPVLLVSLPRSGSTWIGGMLGSAETAMYLGEPLNRRLRMKPEFPHAAAPSRQQTRYDRLAALALRGIPRFGRAVVRPRQWRFAERAGKTVVVKEIDPLRLVTGRGRPRPLIIYLVRHPAAVAHSYRALGWTNLSKLRYYFGRSAHAESFMERIGAIQAVIQNEVMRRLSGRADCMLVRYEDVCADPMAEFARLFAFAGLPFSSDSIRRIEASSRATAVYEAGRPEIARDSAAMVDLWKSQVSAGDVALLRKGYLDNAPSFYADPSDW